VLIAAFTHGPVSTVDSVREVASNGLFIVQEPIRAGVGGHHVSVVHLAVIILPAVLGVCMPARREGFAVVFSTRGLGGGGSNAVLIARPTDWSISTPGVFNIVTSVEHKVPHLTVWTHEMLPLALVAVPVLPTIEGVCPPSISSFLTVQTVSTVCGARSGGCGEAVDRVTAGSRSTLDIFWILTPSVSIVE
jgi:hypothetical protein